jgi:curved DNA-binding protein CbpA
MKWKNRKPQLSDEIARLKDLDPYEMLGLASNATADEIKSAYRRLVKVYHPDKADAFMRKHNEQIVRLINDAHERLLGRNEGDK